MVPIKPVFLFTVNISRLVNTPYGYHRGSIIPFMFYYNYPLKKRVKKVFINPRWSLINKPLKSKKPPTLRIHIFKPLFLVFHY